jgi:hypothetical protein
MEKRELYQQYCEEFWKHFLNTETAQARKSVTFWKWVARTNVARKAMAAWLSEHGAQKLNPYYWVQDFPEPVPTDYNGKDIPTDKELYIALYKGQAGIYSRQDVEDFEMTIKKRFSL